MRFLVCTADDKLSYIQAALGCDAADKSGTKPIVTSIYHTSKNVQIQGIVQLSFPSPSKGDADAVAVALSTGETLILDSETGEELSRITPSSASNQGEDKGEVIAIEYRHGYLITCTRDGSARFTKLSSLWGTAQQTLEVKLPGPIGAFRSHPEEPGTIAFGGQENDLQIWSSRRNHAKSDDAEQAPEPFSDIQAVWAARNVKNDRLDLRVPVWITDLCFLPQMSGEGYGVVTVTKYKQIRIYNTRTARRPTSSLELSQNAISRVLLDTTRPEALEQYVIFTDSTGNVFHANIHKGTLVGSFKGFSGAVGSVTASEDGETLAAGGMDTYLRAFDVSTHREVLNVYCGAKINHVAILPEELDIKSETDLEDDEEEGEEDKDVWDRLEEVTERPSKKSRHN